jgi:hypothetical protein
MNDSILLYNKAELDKLENINEAQKTNNEETKYLENDINNNNKLVTESNSIMIDGFKETNEKLETIGDN